MLGSKLMLLILSFLLLLVPQVVSESLVTSNSKELLYFWGGFGWLQKDPLWPDAVYVVDFDQTSPTYGQVLNVAPVSPIALGISILPLKLQIRLPSGNEPHHSGISPDGRWLVAGGLLSFLQASDEIFLYDLQDPVNPTLVFSCDAVGACTDEFVWYAPLNGWLVSQMCSGILSPNIVASDSPGAYVLVKPGTNPPTCTQWSFPSSISPSNTFDPHGFDVKQGVGLVSTDYIWPFSLASPITPITMRNTIRLFGDQDGKQKKIWTIPDAGGFMDTRYIPGDVYDRAITCSTMSNRMYLINPHSDVTPPQIFDLRQLNADPTQTTRSAGILRITGDGKRLIMTHAMRCLVLFNIEDPLHPFILDKFDFCDPDNQLGIDCCQYPEGKPGTHYVLLINDERIVVITYFLAFLKFQYYGTKQAFAFDLEDDIIDGVVVPKSSLVLDRSFHPDFSKTGMLKVSTSVSIPLIGPINTEVQINVTVPSSPHSVQYRKLA